MTELVSDVGTGDLSHIQSLVIASFSGILCVLSTSETDVDKELWKLCYQYK